MLLNHLLERPNAQFHASKDGEASEQKKNTRLKTTYINCMYMYVLNIITYILRYSCIIIHVLLYHHIYYIHSLDSKEDVELFSASQLAYFEVNLSACTLELILSHDFLQFQGAETRLDPSWTSLENLIGLFDEPDDFGQAGEASGFAEIDQFQ